jgi:hypothetical protein
MRSQEQSETRRELADWSQPIIVDYLHELYARELGGGHQSLRVLALSHGRLWRFLIQQDDERLPLARKEIVGIARLAGLKTSVVDSIDQAMLSELMDVVVARFMRTPALARGYSQILLGASAQLAKFGMAHA